MRFLPWLLLAACTGSDTVGVDTDAVDTDDTQLEPSVVTGEGPALVGSIVVEPVADPKVHLAWMLSLEADVPSTVTLVIDDGFGSRRVAFHEVATIHALPLLGLHADADVQVGITLTDLEGRSTELEPASFTTDPLAVALPDLDILVHEQGEPEPGWTVVPLEEVATGGGRMVVLDLDGLPVWLWEAPGQTKGFDLFGRAEYVAIVGARASYRDLMGQSLGVFAELADLPGSIATGHNYHHDVIHAANGNLLALSEERIDVPGYPVDEAYPYTLQAGTIEADQVIELTPAGEVVQVWGLEDVLQTSRIGFGSLDGGNDWTHANAVVDLPERDALVVSARHQDAVIELGRDGQLHWILGNHDGWAPEYRSALLTPLGADFTWPYHQHAPEIEVQPDGTLTVLMLDNGNERASPYNPISHPLADKSRVVQYRVDPDAMTVTLEWQMYGDGRGMPLFSGVMGNADRLPTTGHVLATYSSLKADDPAGSNPMLGRGTFSTRAIEIDPTTDTVVWDLRVSAPAADAPSGWRADRVMREPSLYMELATVEWLDR